MDQYDAIVIGCNISSLISALILLNENKKVLLIDKKNTIGDIVHKSKIGRYSFNYDLHNLYLKNNTFNYSLNKVINICNVENKIRFISLESLCNIKIKDKEYILPFGIDTFIDYLDNEFNGSRESLNKLFNIAELVRDIYDDVYTNKIDFSNIDKEVIKIIDMSLEKGLDYLKINKELKELLCKLTVIFGTDSNISFTDYLLFLINVVERGIQVPKDNLLELLLYEYINKGGNVRFNSNVVNIIIDDNIVNGIRLDNGEVIYTTIVISSIGLDKTYGDLIEAKDIPRMALKHINKREKGYKVFCIYIGLNKDVDYIGIKNYINIINDNMIVYGYKDMLSIHYLLKDDIFINSVNNRNYYFTVDRMTKKIIDELNINIYDYMEEIKVISPFFKDVFDYKINNNDSFIARWMNRDKERYIDGLYIMDGLNGDIFGYNSSLLSGIKVIDRNEGDSHE